MLNYPRPDCHGHVTSGDRGRPPLAPKDRHGSVAARDVEKGFAAKKPVGAKVSQVTLVFRDGLITSVQKSKKR